MFTSSMFLPVLAALVGIIAIHRGGKGHSRVHVLAAVSGAVVVLCISVLPFIALAAVGSFGGSRSAYEPLFIGYAVAAGISLLTALVCLLRLMSARTAT